MNYVTEASRFFDDVVVGWMIGDLDNMTSKISPKQFANGNCNFPIALYTFTCLEFLGYLTSLTLIDRNTTKAFTSDRINSYMNMFFEHKYLTQIASHKDKFVNIFRNGLAHEYFAKSAGISRTAGTLITLDTTTGSIVLDADEFYKAFKNSTQKLKQAIDGNANNIAETLMTRYSDLQTVNMKYKPTLTTFSYTSSSRASLPHPDALKSTTTLPYKKPKP